MQLRWGFHAAAWQWLRPAQRACTRTDHVYLKLVKQWLVKGHKLLQCLSVGQAETVSATCMLSASCLRWCRQAVQAPSLQHRFTCPAECCKLACATPSATPQNQLAWNEGTNVVLGAPCMRTSSQGVAVLFTAASRWAAQRYCREVGP